MLQNVLKKIDHEASSFDAESSFYFLRDFTRYSDWNVYSSKNYPVEIINSLVDSFCMSHGQVNIASVSPNSNSVWSMEPLGIFRYEMDSNNFWKELSYTNNVLGYLVQGAYWNNGFFYQVKDKKNIVETNLFIDDSTRVRYNYPETPHKTL
jgi:hypothetical protein